MLKLQQVAGKIKEIKCKQLYSKIFLKTEGERSKEYGCKKKKWLSLLFVKLCLSKKNINAINVAMLCDVFKS